LNNKSIFKIFIVIVVILVIVYFFCCLIFSIFLNKNLKEIYNSNSFVDLKNPICVEETVYNYMKSMQIDFYNDVDSYDYDATFPISIIGLKNIKVYYKYTYILYDSNGETLAGCKDVDTLLDIEFINGKFIITDIKERI